MYRDKSELFIFLWYVGIQEIWFKSYKVEAWKISDVAEQININIRREKINIISLHVLKWSLISFITKKEKNNNIKG